MSTIYPNYLHLELFSVQCGRILLDILMNLLAFLMKAGRVNQGFSEFPLFCPK